MTFRKHSLAVRFILWSGLTERGTCCALCKMTLTVLSIELALFNAQNWRMAGLTVATGAALDVFREVLDRLLGRPGVQYLNKAEYWTSNKVLMTRVKAMVVLVIVIPALLIIILGVIYGIAAPLEGQELKGLYRVVADNAPDLSSVVQITRRWGLDLRDQGFPKRAEVVTSFVDFIFMVSCLASIVSVSVAARPFALYSAEWARRQGAHSYSEHAAIIALYVFILLLLLISLAAYNHGSPLSCSGRFVQSSICGSNSRFFLDYAVVNALSVVICCGLQSTIENGCHEYSDGISVAWPYDHE